LHGLRQQRLQGLHRLLIALRLGVQQLGLHLHRLLLRLRRLEVLLQLLLGGGHCLSLFL